MGAGFRSSPLAPLGALSADARLLFAARGVRLFAYGFLSVVFVLYLAALGLDEASIGLFLTATLLGDTALTLWISTRADRAGRRRMLALGALLVACSGAVFAGSGDPWLLLAAATLGVMSPSGNEVGPFLAIEQAALVESLAHEERTAVLAWYNLVGALATATGALAAGAVVEAGERLGLETIECYRLVLGGYALAGIALLALFTRLSPASEARQARASAAVGGRFGLRRSRRVVLGLAGLFALDSFAGGFVMQSVLAYWLQQRWGTGEGALGALFFGINVLAGLSSLGAAAIARRIGLLNTMVFTHMPSSALLVLVPLAPSFALAAALLLLRACISQMDVPTRQSFTLAVVEPDERSSAAGIAGVARTVGAGISPLLTGLLLSRPALLAWPFFLAGGLKLVYDLALFASFRRVLPPEERRSSR
jgi:MFS family permease